MDWCTAGDLHIPEGASLTIADPASCGVEYERLVTVHGTYDQVHRGAGELVDALYDMPFEVLDVWVKERAGAGARRAA